MKNARDLIISLVVICVLLALTAFFLPNASGTALCYVTISVACIVGLLCLGSILSFFLYHR